MKNKYALHIIINCCEKGLQIMHLGPILLNSRVKVGKNCSFHINSELVAGGTFHDVSTLGDGVFIGVRAAVLGGYITNDIAICVSLVVNKDFFEESIVIASVPAKKISNNGRSKWGNFLKVMFDYAFLHYSICNM